jgi:hypothetical protein
MSQADELEHKMRTMRRLLTELADAAIDSVGVETSDDDHACAVTFQPDMGEAKRLWTAAKAARQFLHGACRGPRD